MRFVLAFLIASPAFAQAQTVTVAPKPTTEQLAVVKPTTEQLVEADRVRLWNAASPALRVKLDAPVKALLAKSDVKPKPGEPPIDLVVESRKLATGLLAPNAPAVDIEALASLILMQAAKAAQDDLKAMMEQLKNANDKKSAMREEVAAIKLSLYQNRNAVLAKTVSSLQKKFSDTSSMIVANMK